MSRFGSMIGGKKTPAPAPAPIAEPIVEEVVEEPTFDEVVEEVVEEPTFDEVVGEVVEEPTSEEEVIELLPYESDVSFHDMTKKELEEYGRIVGIELDRRRSKENMIQELEDYLEGPILELPTYP
tara:strand:- start:306 stop:680 length:375 start_codon:yes stop_codon:yes gene_type:complete